MFVYVREKNIGAWHYALAGEVYPLCVCPCNSAGVPMNRGDTACRCPCHTKGTKYTPTLCGKKPVTRWGAIRISFTGRVTICQDCHLIACRPIKREVGA